MDEPRTLDQGPRRRPAGVSAAEETKSLATPSGVPDSTLNSVSQNNVTRNPLLAAGATTAVPSRIGKFEVRRLLGSGAFGCVFHAYDPELCRDVAIKVPRPEALSPEFRERFIREARAAATIHHPNVCPVHDVGTESGVPYIVMGFVNGKTLAQIIRERRGPFPTKHAVAVVRKLALAVEAAHKKGIVHRDLKPSNILVDAETRDVMITDFGLAKLVGEMNAGATKIGDVLGTPAYMSPEQARGAIDSIGPQSDVYSLGVILYELLSGEVPFHGTVTEVIGQLLAAEPKPVSRLRPDIDGELDAICQIAMSKDLAERFANAREFANTLGEYLKSLSGTTITPIEPPAVPEVSVNAVRSVVQASVAPVAVPDDAFEEWTDAPVAETRSKKSSRKRARRRAAERRFRQRVWYSGGAIAALVVVVVVVLASRQGSKSKPPTTSPSVALEKPTENSTPTPRKSAAPPIVLPTPTVAVAPPPTPVDLVPPQPPAVTPTPPTNTLPTTAAPTGFQGRPSNQLGPNGKPILVDIDGRPIPLGPDGNPAPLDPEGRVPPHLRMDGMMPGKDGRPPPKDGRPFGPDGRPPQGPGGEGPLGGGPGGPPAKK